MFFVCQKKKKKQRKNKRNKKEKNKEEEEEERKENPSELQKPNVEIEVYNNNKSMTEYTHVHTYP